MSDAIEVDDLTVVYRSRRGVVQAVNSVSFAVPAGETVSIVGESGSGKSTIAQTLLGILPADAHVTGTVKVLGHDVVEADEKERVAIRGRIVGFVPQDPQTSLDPTMRIGNQLSEIVARHTDVPREQRSQHVLELLEEVGFDDPLLRASQYPHELSGGLKQRVLIAAALASDPQIIVADEPTSALDVTVQKTVLDLLTRLVEQRHITLVMITHDLAVASDRTSHVIVMRRGGIVEQGETRSVLRHPTQAYTRRLLESAPAFAVAHREQSHRDQRADSADSFGADDADRNDDGKAVAWKSVTKRFAIGARRSGGEFTALDHVSIAADRGRTLAIVGESGSGKSTLLRIALGLETPTEGTVTVEGRDLSRLRGSSLRGLRRSVQLVQQNPLDSIDPHFTVERAIAEPLSVFRIGDRAARRRRVLELLDKVALPASIAGRRASELSGGQCQRVAIARALSIDPKVLLLDEPVSALDVSVQAQILDLLADLQRELHLTYVFVSHDLAVVAQIAHRIAVLERGHLVEYGTAEQVLERPTHPYTRRLIEAIPGRAAVTEEVPAVL
ncbi:ABC transporter ATP-binding protein [Bifidobacterium margollesii]|uniref:ABC transporter ATP-binding protein n=1 Tax=Bifidobacterium margollesii TaxID=2020964 RepID=A0A2N5JBY3_9BIFI|nr:ABC transporter ATP-binding protein [Bifidobacterium margollesii]PLS31691.1 ABC transporter ATP-binding protein [Bifidobacterium margollesii]